MTTIKPLPTPEHLHHNELKALMEQLRVVHNTYISGNKSTARAMLSQIKYNRRMWSAMYLLQVGEEHNNKDAMQQLIASVTN